MNYVKSFNLLGAEAQQIPCITGEGAPTTATEGAVGCLYMDSDNGKVYKCISAFDNVYVWEKNLEGNEYTDGDKGTVNLSSNFLKYGYKDVYILKEGVDILVDENGTLTKVLQKPDYDVIAVPDSVKKLNLPEFDDEKEEPVLNWMKTLILPETVESICGQSVGNCFYSPYFVPLLVVLNPKCSFEMDDVLNSIYSYQYAGYMKIKSYTNSTAHEYVNRFNKLFSEQDLSNSVSNAFADAPYGRNIFGFTPIDVENSDNKNICYLCGIEQLAKNTIYDILPCDNIVCLLPDNAETGDWVRLDFVSEDTPTTLNIYAMCGMSDIDLVPEANTIYTLYFDYGKLDVQSYGWRFSYNEYKKVEE